MKTTSLWNTHLGRGLGFVALAAVAIMGGLAACGGDDSDAASFTPGTGGGGGSAGAAGSAGSSSCSAPSQLCSGVCTPVNLDANNCGMCGKKCAAGEVCSNGTCALSCGGGTTKCGDKCVDTASDEVNCGSCGNACKSGEMCSASKCAVTCSGGTSNCDGKCLDLNSDPANCGGCAKACASGEVCSGGKCGSQCTAPQINCNGKCTDTNLDPANCGACGTQCKAGELCSTGACAANCGGGTTACGTKCADTAIDPANCGACANACGQGEICSAGTCASSCGSGTQLCGGKCADINNDPMNCGACDNKCGGGQICSAGKCTCAAGLTLCNGSCVNTEKNASNCGTCGKVCSTGETCVNSICSTGQCPGGLVKCGVDCVNLSNDAANCGGCGQACSGGNSCVAGVCSTCDSATTDCDGDGWLVSEGDCCDKPGLCGSDPSKVNPGAIEVVGNAIDDNCNNKTDLFDMEDTVPCDSALTSNPQMPADYAKALGVCRTTEENPGDKKNRTWGLIDAKIVRADGSPLGDWGAVSIRDKFGSIQPAPLEGGRVVVLSSGISADSSQTNPGPNVDPGDTNVSSSHTPSSSVSISNCSQPYCVKDWFATPNLPLKPANGLPDSPSCSSSDSSTANDSVMIVLRMRAPTNVRAFSFNSYFFSAEYPEYVCSSFNDQFIALVDTPSGTPAPIPNPIDKNLMTYTNAGQQWPIGINIAHDTSLFAVCESQTANPSCWESDVSSLSCGLGPDQLTGTGFDLLTGGCRIGGGTYWLTTAGNVIPGQVVELRIALWDVGDSIYDSLAVIDGFKWLASATLPGTGN